jgi:hypothetical protein
VELALSKTDRLDLNSVDLSLFSAEALDEVLAGTPFSILSENDLFGRLLTRFWFLVKTIVRF